MGSEKHMRFLVVFVLCRQVLLAIDVTTLAAEVLRPSSCSAALNLTFR